jgi:hypothetical protein
VKKAESEQIVIALRDRGFPVEYILAPDEGHGFARPVNSMALFAASEAFFAKHLKGRVQTGATPEVTARLKELTVDPKTVVLTAKADPAAVGAPKPTADLLAGTSTFQGTIVAGGQTMPITVTRTIKEDGGSWVVSDAAKLPMGEASDTAVLDKGTLVLTKRSVKQGPAQVDVAFKNGRANGTLNMGGQEKPIDTEVGGELYADGPGAHESLARLPLGAGYTTTFRNFDMQRQKATLKQAKVVGEESVATPAGTFKAWKVEVSSAEGEPGQTTIWIADETRKVVKTSATLPQMGGAVVTLELQP